MWHISVYASNASEFDFYVLNTAVKFFWSYQVQEQSVHSIQRCDIWGYVTPLGVHRHWRCNPFLSFQACTIVQGRLIKHVTETLQIDKTARFRYVYLKNPSF